MQIRSLILTSLLAVGACVVEAGAPEEEALGNESQAAIVSVPIKSGGAHGMIIHRKDGAQTIPVSAISGGTIRADANGVSYGRFSVDVPWTNAQSIVTEVLMGTASSYEAVDLVDANFQGTVVRGRKLLNALITSIKIPDLDAASKDAINKVTIEVLAQDGFIPLPAKEIGGHIPGPDGHYPSSFKIDIAGLDLTRASKVTGIVWQHEPGLDVVAQPELAITVSNVGGQADALYSAFQSYNVFNGTELAGSLQLLGTDLKPVTTFSFSGMQFSELGDVPPASADAVPQILFKTKVGNVDSVK